MSLSVVLRYLYPQADPLRDYVLGDEGLGDGPQIVAWTLDTPQPTPEELEAALPAAQARAADQAEMDEVGAELAERYSLHARALALRKAQTAQEIEEEAASLLAYQQEIRDRATTSPS